ncbi:MAG: general secretion pathway protein GspE [Planctomycetaceae bacterium]|nr:MAG: general secretion pathway protein GspE [Planctomycetaceae bacterium]
MDIGHILVQRGLVTPEKLEEVRPLINGTRLDQALIDRGLITEEAALQAFADELGMDYVDVKKEQIDREVLSLFPTSAVFKYSMLPLYRRQGRVVIAVSDPFQLEALEELSLASGQLLEPVLARKSDVVEMIKDHLGLGGDTLNELVAQRAADGVELLSEVAHDDSDLEQMAEAASVIKLVNELLVEACEQGASDVHIEPQENGLIIRFRVDGVLRIQPVPESITHFYAAIVTRLKIMSKLNIAEKRVPQDGRIKLKVSGREIDVRVSIIPMVHGEGVVLRLLDKGRMVFNLANVGMPPDMAREFHELINLPHGILLVTGPTGSGKSTTLYSALNEIKDPSIKIITVEDPVEYQIPGICQIQVHTKVGLTFAAGLRSILRHDPDVILIGEIRDSETAESAIQAALTGHMVFSTLHTNDAPGAFTRLVDMGVEPYLVASTVEGVLAQRLVRVLCPYCKEKYKPAPGTLPPDFPHQQVEYLYREKGCRECRQTGYIGRRAIFELLRTDQEIGRLCVARASSAEIRNYALKKGMTTLRQSGFTRVLDGTTSLDEVLRITRRDVS